MTKPSCNLLFNLRPIGSHAPSPRAHLSCRSKYRLSLRACSRVSSDICWRSASTVVSTISSIHTYTQKARLFMKRRALTMTKHPILFLGHQQSEMIVHELNVVFFTIYVPLFLRQSRGLQSNKNLNVMESLSFSFFVKVGTQHATVKGQHHLLLPINPGTLQLSDNTQIDDNRCVDAKII